MSLSYSDARLRRLYYAWPAPIRNAFASGYSLREHGKRFGGVFTKRLEELRLNSKRSYDEVIADQHEQTRRMLAFAQRYVPYYQDLFRSVRFDAEGPLRLPDDLGRIPILEKETLRQKSRQFQATCEVGPTFRSHTSGTTGKGLHLLTSLEANQYSYACMWFHYSWEGINRGDRVATFAGHPIADPRNLKPPFWVRDYFENEMLFSSQHLTPTTLPLYANALSKFKPSIIRGYPSSISLLAFHLLETERVHIRPKAVFTSSETLLDFQREAIEKAFGCKVYSYYANTERVAHVLQCCKGNFHIMTDTCLVELVSPDGTPVAPGEEGEMICTGLIDRAMPLIRYKVGDTAVASPRPCPCGLNGPILSAITGRIEDIVITPDGRHVGRLDHAFKDMLNVREAQIIQEDVNLVRVMVVPRTGFGVDDEKVILNELRLRLGGAIGIEVQVTDSIPRTTAGKLRFVVSKVPTRIGSRFANPATPGAIH